MAGVEADGGALAEGGHVRVRGAPVRHVHRVEVRLEDLVLEHEALVLAEAGVDLLEGVGETVLPAAEVGLAGVVGAVREPDLQVTAAGGVHDVDAVHVVVDGLLADAWVAVGEGAELVVVVLEDVRVDGAEREPEVRGVRGQGGVVIHPVPWDVQGNARGEARVGVHLGRVLQLLLDGSQGPGGGEHLEAGPRVAVGPGGDLDGEALELLEGGGVEHSVSGLLRVGVAGRRVMNRFIRNAAGAEPVKGADVPAEGEEMNRGGGSEPRARRATIALGAEPPSRRRGRLPAARTAQHQPLPAIRGDGLHPR